MFIRSRLPAKQPKREKWIQEIKKHQEFDEIKNLHTICELHFAKEHVVNNKVKDDAVLKPSVASRRTVCIFFQLALI